MIAPRPGRPDDSLRSIAVPNEELTSSRRDAITELLNRVTPIADDLGRVFASAGHELALVGGPVRDVLLGREVSDLDFTTDARPERILEIIDGWADAVWTIGIEFGTVGLRKGEHQIEITTYRSESYDPKSRKPEVAYGTSLEDDLARRDFAVNAMAARLPGHEFVDPYGGLDDLRAKLIRTPGRPEDSFGDDPLRMLRAARFSSQLGFTRRPAVVTAMTEMASPHRDRLGRAGTRRAVQAAARAPARATAWRCSSTPAWPRRCCPSCPSSGWRSTSTTGTRTSTSTR